MKDRSDKAQNEMELQYVDVKDVVIPRYHRATKPWVLKQIKRSMEKHGYNIAYPITLDGQNTLVDGRHRLEAAKELGIARVHWIRKPNGVSPIRFALQCNADGQLCSPNDVFDLAELCYGLSQEGWTGEQIAGELGWDEPYVTRHKQICELLHPKSWQLSRAGFPKKPELENDGSKSLETRNCQLATDDDQELSKQGLPIGNWRESHFRALLKHLPCSNSDRGAIRAQMAVIQHALKRWETNKVTAKWMEEVAMRYAWHLKLKRYTMEHLVPEVGISDRKTLFKSINNNVFGREESGKNEEKLSQAVSLLNEKALGVRLYWDDALQRIPMLKNSSVPLVIADPPYNVTDAPWDRFPSPENYLEWLETWLEVLRPKLTRDYHLFLFCHPSYMARIEELLVQHGWPIKSRIIWAYRNLSMGRDVADRFISSWQLVFHCGNHPLNWSPDWSDERFDMQLHATPQSNFEDKKQHPMAKPLKLIELFVRVGSKPGDIVLDPFAGGGVTGEACSTVKQRRCILVEKDEKFVETIERRLGIKRTNENDD